MEELAAWNRGEYKGEMGTNTFRKKGFVDCFFWPAIAYDVALKVGTCSPRPVVESRWVSEGNKI